MLRMALVPPFVLLVLGRRVQLGPGRLRRGRRPDGRARRLGGAPHAPEHAARPDARPGRRQAAGRRRLRAADLEPSAVSCPLPAWLTVTLLFRDAMLIVAVVVVNLTVGPRVVRTLLARQGLDGLQLRDRHRGAHRQRGRRSAPARCSGCTSPRWGCSIASTATTSTRRARSRAGPKRPRAARAARAGRAASRLPASRPEGGSSVLGRHRLCRGAREQFDALKSGKRLLIRRGFGGRRLAARLWDACIPAPGRPRQDRVRLSRASGPKSSVSARPPRAAHVLLPGSGSPQRPPASLLELSER